MKSLPSPQKQQFNLQFFTDENILASLVRVIREEGFSVKDVKEENIIGASDKELLAIAQKEKRIFITFDKDFINFPLASHQGIIVIRYRSKHTTNVVPKFISLLRSPLKENFANNLCEVFDEYVKITRAKP